MEKDNLPLKSFAIGGYRSFGRDIQRFGSLSQINLFIGKNNSGKSNILRFLHDVYPNLSKRPVDLKLTQLDRHVPSEATFRTSISTSIKLVNGNYADLIRDFSKRIPNVSNQASHLGSLIPVFQEKAKHDSSDDSVWFDFDAAARLIPDGWARAFKVLDDYRMMDLWGAVTNQRGGSRDQNWVPETIASIAPTFNGINVALIPAVRQIGKKHSVSEEFSGDGIIERLAKLQHPDILNQHDKKRFEQINEFLRNVIDNESVSIEVPHERDTIHVQLDGKTLPLEFLGTGVHEVIILAAAATLLENNVICMEEPELHLNPILQKKLMRYLALNTNNQYFITTHSAALMDTPDAEIYHVNIVDGQSIVERVTSDKQRSTVCEDLGYHPSDLMQSNCVIWVEGPSDRVYINHWIQSLSPGLIEGIHYSIMFYGGRLASHLSGEDIDVEGSVDSFISLRRLNRRGVIVIDSDKADEGAQINATKKRLMDEFERGPGYAWVTMGREIENYVNSVQVKNAILRIHPEAKPKSKFGLYENTLKIKSKTGKDTQASKIEVAKCIVSSHPADLTILDLEMQISKLITFIMESNPTAVFTDSTESKGSASQ